MARTPVRGKKIKSISELIKDAEERKEKVKNSNFKFNNLNKLLFNSKHFGCICSGKNRLSKIKFCVLRFDLRVNFLDPR